MAKDWTLTMNNTKELYEKITFLTDTIAKGLQSGPVVVNLGRIKRSLDQNRKLWPMLNDVSKQVEWYGRKLKSTDWKDIFSAALRGCDVVPGINGGFVVLGLHTSDLTKKEFSDLIEIMYAFGADHEVKWSEEGLAIYDEVMQAA